MADFTKLEMGSLVSIEFNGGVVLEDGIFVGDTASGLMVIERSTGGDNTLWVPYTSMRLMKVKTGSKGDVNATVDPA